MSEPNTDFFMQINEQAINSSNIAMRTLILINGGAAVAMLAFVGSLVGNHSLNTGGHLAQLTMPLLWFGWGIAMAAVTMFFAYFTNYTTAAHAAVLNDDGGQARMYAFLKVCFHVIALGAAISSLVFFLGGMYRVRAAILVAFA